MKEYRVEMKQGNGEKWIAANGPFDGERIKTFSTNDDAQNAMFEYAKQWGAILPNEVTNIFVFRVVSRNVTEWKAV